MSEDPAHHSRSAGQNSDDAQKRWNEGHFAFVTLWSRRETGLRVLDWLATAEIPPNSTLYWMDNSGGLLAEVLREGWARRLSRRFRKLVRMEAREPFKPKPGQSPLHPSRHLHIARLYNSVLRRVVEEAVVLLEDDTVPPRDGLRGLVNELQETARVGAVAGVYRDRLNPDKICAALDKHQWLNAPLYDALPTEPFEIGMTGGGFTLLLNRALQQAMPLACKIFADGHALGWDAKLCADLTALGYRILAHPGVRCAHLCSEVVAYEAALARGAQ